MKYFTLKEFDSPDEPGSGKYMDKEFLEMLDLAREEAEVPFKITSGFRTKEYNDELLRKGYSASSIVTGKLFIHMLTRSWFIRRIKFF